MGYHAAGQNKSRLEATGHYSYNLLGPLLDSGLATYVLNPLHTDLYQKSFSSRKSRPDRVDARTIAAVLMSGVGLRPYADTVHHNEELKSRTKYRFDKTRERTKLKQSVSRLLCLLFPGFETLVSSLRMASVYALLDAFPGAAQIAGAYLTRLKFLPAKSLELRHTIVLI